jgi:Zn ribbon nucleic-acid-binding protein
MAARLTLTAVAAALVFSALGSVAFTMALHDTVASGLLTFAMFGGLAAMTAGVLAWEVASGRTCPRCQTENSTPLSDCAGCGYDMRARPRFACTEGHRVAYTEGLCDCGRRLLPLHPVPLGRHVLRVVGFALAFFVLVVVVGIVGAMVGAN